MKAAIWNGSRTLDVVALKDRLGTLVSHRFRLDCVNRAFAADESTGSIKVQIRRA